MKEVNLFCAECGGKLSSEEPIFQGPEHQGQFLCELCFHELEIVHWHKHLNLSEMADLLNQADYYRWTQFCISFIGGPKRYIVSKDAHPSVFSILTTRDELVRIIESKKEH